MDKKRKYGIILLVLGMMSVTGASVNGSFTQMANGITLSNIVTILIMIGLIVAGLVLIITGKKIR